MIEAIQNVLLLAGFLAIGGVVFVAVGMGVVSALDILGNDYD